MHSYESRRLHPGAPLVVDVPSAEVSGSSPSGSFVQIVLRRKGTIATFAVVCGLLAFALTLPQTRLYRAHASLEFAGLNDNVMNTRDVDPSATGDNSSQAFINTQARVLESKPLLERVVRKVKANAKPSDLPSRKRALDGLTVNSFTRGSRCAL